MSLTIGMFTDTYVPQINGVATLLPILDRLLGRLGHKVYIFAPSYEGRRPKLEDGHIFRFPALRFIYHKESRVTIPYFREARRAFEELDLVHSHTPFSLGVLGIRVAHRYAIPHLHTYHTLFTEYLHYLPRYLRPSPKMVARISAAFCNRCDGVTVPSNPMREELISYGIRVPVYTLPFGMDLEDFSGEPRVDMRARLGIPKAERVLLCAGRVAEEKNISFVLRSFGLMLEEMPNLMLVIAGDGPARPRLELEARELGIASRVIFTGYVAWRELIDYYKQADLFVYGSKTETQGIVFVESLAAGTPVVAVGEMGAKEAVEDGVSGLLVEEDEEIFAKAVTQLLRDEERLKQMGRAALERAYKMSAQRSVERLLEIYKELIEAKRLAHQA